MRAVALAALALAAMAPSPGGAATGHAAAPARCADDAGWNDPARPRRVYGNTWYVGTCGISALLVTGPKGHVLVDAGTAEAAPQVAANIRALGFRVEDIRAIVGSHPHDDHAGGLAQLQRATHAPVFAREPALRVLAKGRSGEDDPQFRVSRPFPAVPVLRTVADGGHVRVGALDLTAHATPGHAPGSTSWTWRSCADARCVDIAYVDSVTAVSDDTYRFSDDAAHPGVLAAFRASLDRIARLPCDLLVTPHPAASGLWDRIGPGATRPLVAADGCRAYATDARARLDARIAREAAP